MAPFGALLLSNPFASRHHRCPSVLFSLLFVTESRNQDVIWWENSLFFSLSFCAFMLQFDFCTTSVSRFNFQPNTKSILVCWSLKSKKNLLQLSTNKIAFFSMVLKGISAFPIGRLGARKKDYKKKEIITQNNTWKPLFDCIRLYL